MDIPAELLNEHYNDRYFDVVNAMDEAEQVFFNGCNVVGSLLGELFSNKDFRIGETGFGAGRTLCALMELLPKKGIANRRIVYNSVELHPLVPDRLASILERFRPRAQSSIAVLTEAYGQFDLGRPGWNTATVERPFGTLTLNIYIGEALEMVKELKEPCDAWFLDGHSPLKNPAIWRPELMLEIGNKTVINGTCATYTVSGAVRRALKAAGFVLDQTPGFGEKRNFLRGVKQEVLK